MYAKYVFAQDVFDLCKLEISNSQQKKKQHKFPHSVPKYVHDNSCIVHKWLVFFVARLLLIFLLSPVRLEQLQCRKFLITIRWSASHCKCCRTNLIHNILTYILSSLIVEISTKNFRCTILFGIQNVLHTRCLPDSHAGIQQTIQHFRPTFKCITLASSNSFFFCVFIASQSFHSYYV